MVDYFADFIFALNRVVLVKKQTAVDEPETDFTVNCS